MKKFLVTVAIFVLISLSAFSAIGSNYKNSLLSVDVNKTGESSYNIVLKTQSPYAEPIKVIKKSDYDYYILLPETYSLIPESNSNSDIKNFSVQLFPYAGQSSENGYTKITILTVRPLNFTTSIKSIDNNMPTRSDLDKIAKLDALDKYNQTKNVSQTPVVSKQTTQPQAQPVQKTQTQVAQKPQTQKTSSQTQQTKPQAQPVQKTQTQVAQKPQTQVTQKTQQPKVQTQKQSIPQSVALSNKATNPINVSTARKENIITYNTESKEVKPQEVKPAQPQETKKVASVQPKKVTKSSSAKQTKQKTVSKPKQTQKSAKQETVKPKTTPQVAKQEATPQVSKQEKTPEVQTPPKQVPQQQAPEVQASETQNTEIQTQTQNIPGEEAQQTVENQNEENTDVMSTFPDDELTSLEDETPPDDIKTKIMSKINGILSSMPISRSKIIIAILLLIIFIMAIGKRKKQPEVRVVYRDMPPQNTVVQEKPLAREELAPNTYVEEPDFNEPIIEERPVIEPNIPRQNIEEPEIAQSDVRNNVIQREHVQEQIVNEQPVIVDQPVSIDENDEIILPDELNDVDLDEIDNMEAIEEKLDQEEFEADEEIEIEEVESIVNEESATLQEEPVMPQDEQSIEEDIQPQVNYEVEEPKIEEVQEQNYEPQYAKQNDIAVQNPIKEQPHEDEEERGADVLSSVQIDSNKGFCVTYYNNQLILIGYVGENIFLIHKFKRGEISNAQIKFRLSDSNLNEDFYMVKVDNSKFMVKVTPNSMALELLV